MDLLISYMAPIIFKSSNDDNLITQNRHLLHLCENHKILVARSEAEWAILKLVWDSIKSDFNLKRILIVKL